LSHSGQCPALPAALGPRPRRPTIAPCIPWHLAHAGATECIGSGEKSRDHLFLIGTNSDVAAPSLRDYQELQTALEILCNHVMMNDGMFYNR
jgi:hypothetical protein